MALNAAGRRTAAIEQVQTLSQEEAKAQLAQFRGALKTRDGHTQPGVLTLQRTQDGYALRTARWYQSRTTAADASAYVNALIEKAYGHQDLEPVRAGVTAYLGTVSQKFGSKSFAKLLDTLDGKPREDAETGGRLNLGLYQPKSPDAVARGEALAKKPAEATHATFRNDSPPPEVVETKADTPSPRLPNRDTDQPQALPLGFQYGFEKVHSPPESVTLNCRPAPAKLSISAAESLTTLADALSPAARTWFERGGLLIGALTVPGIEPHQSPTYVLADADGSLARVVLLAIQSGHLTLPPDALKDLAQLMLDEYDCLGAGGKNQLQNLKNLQADQTRSERMDRIVEQARFQASDNKLVFIGDILYDRLTTNQPAMKALIEGLHGQGAIFIKGNHEDGTDFRGNRSLLEGFPDVNPMFMGQMLQCGAFAHKSMSEAESKDLEGRFVNAHVDTRPNGDRVLYIHNGFAYDPQTRLYTTAFGQPFAARTAQEFVATVNPRTAENIDVFTGFRPQDRQMSGDAVGPIGQLDKGRLVIVAGHEGPLDVSGPGRQPGPACVRVNARGPGGRGFQPAAVRL